MLIFFATVALDIILQTLFVGLALATLVRHFQWSLPKARAVILLFLLFAFLDSFYLPAMAALDATITVRNQEIADALDLRPDMHLMRAFGFYYVDLFLWAVQATTAWYIAARMVRSMRQKAA